MNIRLIHPTCLPPPTLHGPRRKVFPYAGAEAIIVGVFHRLGTEWIGYKAEVHTFLEDGDKVAAFGTYSGTYKATGKSTRAEFVHLDVLKNGKIQRKAKRMFEAKRFWTALLRPLGSLREGEPAPQLIGIIWIALAQRGQNVTGPNTLQEKLPGPLARLVQIPKGSVAAS